MGSKEVVELTVLSFRSLFRDGGRPLSVRVLILNDSTITQKIFFKFLFLNIAIFLFLPEACSLPFRVLLYFLYSLSFLISFSFLNSIPIFFSFSLWSSLSSYHPAPPLSFFLFFTLCTTSQSLLSSFLSNYFSLFSFLYIYLYLSISLSLSSALSICICFFLSLSLVFFGIFLSGFFVYSVKIL